MYAGASEWNMLPNDTRNCQTVDSFKQQFIRHL